MTEFVRKDRERKATARMARFYAPPAGRSFRFRSSHQTYIRDEVTGAIMRLDTYNRKRGR